MQTPFDSELAAAADDEAMGAGDALDDEVGEHLDAADALEGLEGEGFDDASFEAAEGFEEEEAFEEDAFEEERFDEEMFTESESAHFDADGFDLSGEADELALIEDAFSDAMGAVDEDEFFRGALARLRQVARNPVVRQIARRALPIAQRVIRQSSPQWGGLMAQGLGQVAGQILNADALDAFADIAADHGEDSLDVFTPVVGALAARYAVRTVSRGRRPTPAAARVLGRDINRAATEAARMITRRFGARSIRAVPRVVREVLRIVRRQGASPRAIAPMIRRAAGRVAANPRVAARLSRPNRTAQQIRARAGIGRPATATRPGAARMPTPTQARRMQQVGPNQYQLRGPVRLVFGR